MAYKIFKRGGYFYIVDTDTGREREGLSKDVKVSRGTTSQDDFYFQGINNFDNDISVNITEIQDYSGNSYTVSQFIEFYEGATSMDVTLQSSTSPLVINKATELIAETTLSALAVEDEKTFVVSSTTGALVGQQLTVYSTINNRISFFTVLAINGSTITVDSPIDWAFELGDYAQFGNTNLAVNGSVTPRVFGIRNPTAQDIDLKVDLTRMILSMKLTSSSDYDEFGNIPRLTNGLVCRFVDGFKQNIFNIKDNREMDTLMYELKFIPASGNAPDGLSGRFTFEKLGSVIRLRPFEDLQFIVQDNLTSITTFEIETQGAGVTN